MFLLLTAAVIALLLMAPLLGISSVFVPRLGDMVGVWSQNGWSLARNVFISWNAASVAFIAGVLIGSSFLIPALIGHRRPIYLTLCTMGLGFATAISLLFGEVFFAYGLPTFVSPALAVAFGAGLILQREREQVSQELRLNEVFRDVYSNALMFPNFPQLYLLGAAVDFLNELMFPRLEESVWTVYRDSLMAFNVAKSSSIVVVFLLSVGITYLLLRAFQGYATMTWIVWPRMRRLRAERNT